MEKLFITGIGVISTIGNDIDTFWSNLIDPKEEVFKKEKVEFNSDLIKKNNLRRLNRVSKGALMSSAEALVNSGIRGTIDDNSKIGTMFYSISPSINSALSFNHQIYSCGSDFASAIDFASSVNNACIGTVAINEKLKGLSSMLNTINYLKYALLSLRKDRVKVMVCGAYEPYNEDYFNDFKNNEYVISDSLESAKPLDMDRNGFKVKEGMATLIIQRFDSEYLEKNSIFSEILYSETVFSSEMNFLHVDNRCSSEVFEGCMESALRKAGISKEQIDAIFMAANGSKQLDFSESKAIENLFSNRANEIPITSIKSVAGETLGANLNMNLAAASLALKNGVIPGNKGLKKLDKKININAIADNVEGNYKYILVNGICGFGGISTTILKKYEE